MLPTIKELFGMPEEPWTTCFYLKDSGHIGYGSPIFVPSSIVKNTQKESKQEKPRPSKMFNDALTRISAEPRRISKSAQAVAISPWMYNNLQTAGAGKTFFSKLLVSSQTVKVWEEDSILNQAKLIEVDHLTDLDIFKSKEAFTNNVFEKGAVFITPNNIKAVDHLCLHLQTLARHFKHSLVHSNNIKIAMDAVSGKRAPFFPSRFSNSKEAMLLPVMFGVDMKYCIPFYDSRSQNGIFVGMLIFILLQHEKGLLIERVSTFSLFLSDYEEGLYSIDCQKIVGYFPVRSNNFSELASMIKKTHPFKPSLLLKDSDRTKTIRQKREKNKLKTEKNAKSIIAPLDEWTEAAKKQTARNMWIEASSSKATYGEYYSTDSTMTAAPHIGEYATNHSENITKADVDAVVEHIKIGRDTTQRFIDAEDVPSINIEDVPDNEPQLVPSEEALITTRNARKLAEEALVATRKARKLDAATSRRLTRTFTKTFRVRAADDDMPIKSLEKMGTAKKMKTAYEIRSENGEPRVYKATTYEIESDNEIESDSGTHIRKVTTEIPSKSKDDDTP